MKKLTLVLLIIGLIAPVLVGQAPADTPLFDLAIINGRIVDGTGNPWFYGSVAIKDGVIVKVGKVDSSRSTRTIDARGMIIAPGFLDVHTHVESSLGDNPSADNFLYMGVTSVVTGNCGGSQLDVGNYLAGLESVGISVNVATLIGHGAVRRQIMREEAREPSPEELQKMRDLVATAMREGAVGMSTGLIYVPGTYAKTDEVVELAKEVARYGGVYSTHMRDEGNKVIDSINETLTIGQQANLPVNISHFKISSKKRWGDTRLTCRLVADARARGQQVTVDQYVYTASSTSLNVLLPSWVLEGGREKAKERLDDPGRRASIKREMIETIHNSGFKDFSYAVVAGYRSDPSYEGKSLVEITKLTRGKSSLDDQAEQIIAMFLAGSAAMVYHKMAEPDVEYIIAQPFAMIASDSGVQQMGRGAPHPRGYGNNARVLGRYVREKRVIGLEDAVRKMTSLPASTFNLWDRGMIRPGLAADIVVFDDKKVGDRATFDKPHQYAEGFAYVVVNGKVVIDGGSHTKAKAGRALYGPGRQPPAEVNLVVR